MKITPLAAICVLASLCASAHAHLPEDALLIIGESGPYSHMSEKVAPEDRTLFGKIAVVSPAGEMLWSHPVSALHDLHLTQNNTLIAQDDFSGFIEIGWDHRVIFEFQPKNPGGGKYQIHAFQPLPEDRFMVAVSGLAKIIEIDRGGNVLKEFPFQLDGPPQTHRDTRLARKLPNGHYLVAHEGEKKVREYGPAGKVVWEYDVGSYVYSAARLDNGNTLIGTGDGSSVIEVNPDKEIVWEIGKNELPGIELGWVTEVKALDDGSYMIVNCHAGKANPQVFAVNSKKEVLWQFKNQKHFNNGVTNVILVTGEQAALLRKILEHSKAFSVLSQGLNR